MIVRIILINAAFLASMLLDTIAQGLRGVTVVGGITCPLITSEFVHYVTAIFKVDTRSGTEQGCYFTRFIVWPENYFGIWVDR